MFNLVIKNRQQTWLIVFLFLITTIGMSFIHSAVSAQENNFAGGDGTEQSPYIIETAEQLNKIRDDLEAHYKLGNDIDLGGIEWNPIGEYYHPINDRNKKEDKRFKGSLDGNNYKIMNLKINKVYALGKDEVEYENIGLFAHISTAKISNLGLEKVHIQGGEYTGGLTGRSEASTIENVYVTGTIKGVSVPYANPNQGYRYRASNIGGITGHSSGSSRIENSYSDSTVSGHRFVGGLVGTNTGEFARVIESYHQGSVSSIGAAVGGLVGQNSGMAGVLQSYSESNVYGSGEMVGGLVGWNHDNAFIRSSYSTGKVQATSITNDLSRAGGLVGLHKSGNTSGTLINDSYSTSDVTGDQKNVGGFVGELEGQIAGSFSTGNVSGTENVGGFVGSSNGSYSVRVENSYSTGNVSGTENIGGFAGNFEFTIKNSYSIGKVTGNQNTENIGGFVGITDDPNQYKTSYWDIESSGKNTSNGGVGQTRADMKEQIKYKEWDFDDVWAIHPNVNDGYPYLRWQDIDVPEKVLENIVLNLNTYKLKPDEVKHVEVIADYDDGSSTNISNEVAYVISDSTIAMISDQGIITGEKAGETTLTVSYEGKTVEATIVVIQLDEINFSASTYTLDVDKEKSIVVTAKFSDDYTEEVTSDVTYVVEDETIAAVDDSGKIKGLKKGETTLTAKYEGQEAVASIIVKEKETPPSPGGSGGTGGSPSSGGSTGSTTPPSPEPENPREPQLIEVELDKEHEIMQDDILIAEVDGNKMTIKMPSNLPGGSTFKIQDAQENTQVTDDIRLRLVGPVFDFTLSLPYDAEQLEDFTLTFPYDSENVDPSKIDVYYYDESLEEWIAQGGEIDDVNGTITIKVNHFSIYGVFELNNDEDKEIMFTDINADDTHYEAIMYMAGRGIVQGYESGEFKQWDNAYRGQMAKMITSALELQLVSESELDPILSLYDDVNKDTDYAEYIAAVTKAGIFKGMTIENSDRRRFGTYDFINREQMATVLVRAFELDQILTDRVNINLKNVSKSHQKNVQVLADLGITNQVDDYRSYENISRGALSTFLYKAIKKAEQ